MILTIIIAALAAAIYTTHRSGNFWLGTLVGFVTGLVVLWVWLSLED